MQLDGINLQLSSSDVGDPLSEKKEVLDLIRESLTEKLEAKRKQKTREELHEVIVATLEEFLPCFTLIGFDFSDDPVILSRANTPLKGEALMGLNKKVLNDIINRKG